MSEIKPTPPKYFLARIFISANESRLRAGWRLILQTVLMLNIGLIISRFMNGIGITSSGNALFMSQIIKLGTITGSVYIARRWLDERSFESLGLKVDRMAFLDVLAGVGITFAQMGFIYLLMIGLGWLSFDGFAWQFDSPATVLFNVLLFLFIFILVGWNEELLSRGYHLQTIASGINIIWAVIFSSAMFGIAHLGNPNANWVSAAGIFLIGVYLAYGYASTRQLWLPIGLHIGWNFFESVIFGFPVSGSNMYALIRIQITGPELWTGGLFGPEAGLIMLPALGVGMGLIYWYTQNRKEGN